METLRWLSVMLHPVMPAATDDIYKQLGLSEELITVDPAGLKWGGLEAGTRIGQSASVFPQIDKAKVMSEIKEESGQLENAAEEAGTPVLNIDQTPKAVPIAVTDGVPDEGGTEQYITIDDFLKVELRVGEVKVAERIPKADKLLRFEIDLGEEKPRQILAGLAEYYDPEKLIGRKVVVVANLKPRKMRGLESQGMICAASLTEDDNPAIATFLEDVKIGARLK